MRFTRGAATALQTLATALLGLMAGFFLAFSVDVVPVMLELDAKNYMATQDGMNHAINSTPFALVYFGAAIMPFIAGLALWLSGLARRAQMWAVLGVVYLLGVFLLTQEINFPINNALALWEPHAASSSWMRERDEWSRANLLRCAVASISFLAALALLTRPRATEPKT